MSRITLSVWRGVPARTKKEKENKGEKAKMALQSAMVHSKPLELLFFLGGELQACNSDFLFFFWSYRHVTSCLQAAVLEENIPNLLKR